MQKPAGRVSAVADAPVRPKSRVSQTYRVAMYSDEAERAAKFAAMLQKGEDCTYHHPHGQLHGRAGRRCVLEDGERFLLRCISYKPAAIKPRMVLMDNLLFQNRGREAEVPAWVLNTLHDTKLRQSSMHSPFAQQAAQAIQMGMTALKASGKDYKVLAFLDDVERIVPDLIDYTAEIRMRRRKKPDRQQSSVFDSTMSYGEDE